MNTLVQPASSEPLPCREEVCQLQRMIRQLEGQSLLWESVAETRAELIRNLRVTLGLDPDASDQEGL
jgi:hypothetical protein